MRRTIFALPATLLLLTACSDAPQIVNEPPGDSTPAAPGEQVASALERDTNPNVDNATMAQLTQSNRAFLVDLFQELRGNEGNLFVSPHSISIALAMTYAGAMGNTKAEMGSAMHFDLGEPALHQAFNALDLELASRAQQTGEQDGDGFRLSIVNQLFGQTGFPFEQPFLDTLAVNYGAGMRLLDFENDPDGCRQLINDWVEDATEDRIEDLLPDGSIDTLTRIVLANAIYFKASWSAPFKASETTDDTFHLLDGETATVPTMHGSVGGTHASGDGWTLVEIPYIGQQVTMGLFVPDAERFAEIEAAFDAGLLEEALGGLSSADITLALPKFSFRSEYDLVPTMQSLGMIDAFGDANFSAMTSVPGLVITGIFHQAFVDVNEQGTEAAAATAVVGGLTSAPEPVTVTIDRPFLFWIRDVPTGAMLFAGRVSDPRG